MDIVLNSRHVEVSDRFRGHVEEKLARLEKHDHRLWREALERLEWPLRVKGIVAGDGGGAEVVHLDGLSRS